MSGMFVRGRFSCSQLSGDWRNEVVPEMKVTLFLAWGRQGVCMSGPDGQRPSHASRRFLLSLVVEDTAGIIGAAWHATARLWNCFCRATFGMSIATCLASRPGGE